MEIHYPSSRVIHIFHDNSQYVGLQCLMAAIPSRFKLFLVFHHGTPFPFKKIPHQKHLFSTGSVFFEVFHP
jgi:hypothetical protein